MEKKRTRPEAVRPPGRRGSRIVLVFVPLVWYGQIRERREKREIFLRPVHQEARGAVRREAVVDQRIGHSRDGAEVDCCDVVEYAASGREAVEVAAEQSEARHAVARRT